MSVDVGSQFDLFINISKVIDVMNRTHPLCYVRHQNDLQVVFFRVAECIYFIFIFLLKISIPLLVFHNLFIP